MGGRRGEENTAQGVLGGVKLAKGVHQEVQKSIEVTERIKKLKTKGIASRGRWQQGEKNHLLDKKKSHKKTGPQGVGWKVQIETPRKADYQRRDPMGSRLSVEISSVRKGK